MCGLMLLSPCCQKPSWWEWTWGNVACRQLYYQGWHASVKKYFVQRLYGELMQQALDGESDLLQVGRRCLPPPLLDHPSPPLRSYPVCPGPPQPAFSCMNEHFAAPAGFPS
jgi:hypothetical protein